MITGIAFLVMLLAAGIHQESDGFWSGLIAFIAFVVFFATLGPIAVTIVH